VPLPRVLRNLAVAVSPVAAIHCASVPPPPAGYDEALREVRRNERSPRGDAYHRVIEKEILPEFRRASRQCSVREPDTLGARFLYKLDQAGVPVQTLVHPDTAFAQCVREAIGDFDLSPPPEPDYWIEIRIPPRGSGTSRPANSPNSGRINW
jgi:hypothetical protein